jgi:hypothetical protein
LYSASNEGNIKINRYPMAIFATKPAMAANSDVEMYFFIVMNF